MLRFHGEAEARTLTRSEQAQAGTALVTVPCSSRGKRPSPDRCCRCAGPPAVLRKQVRGRGAAVGPARAEGDLRRDRCRAHRVCAQIRNGVGSTRAAGRLKSRFRCGQDRVRPGWLSGAKGDSGRCAAPVSNGLRSHSYVLQRVARGECYSCGSTTALVILFVICNLCPAGRSCSLPETPTPSNSRGRHRGRFSRGLWKIVYFFAHRAFAAFWEMAFRRAGVSASARRLPPTSPAWRALSWRSSAVIDAARSLASVTAAAFFTLVFMYFRLYLDDRTIGTQNFSCFSCARQA